MNQYQKDFEQYAYLKEFQMDFHKAINCFQKMTKELCFSAKIKEEVLEQTII